MKLHLNLVQAVVQALEQIFNQRHYADKVIENLLKSNPKWGARDRAFIAEQVYGVVRYWRYLLFINQLPYQDEIEEYPLKTIGKAIGAYLLLKKYELPPWEIFGNINPSQVFYTHKQHTSLEFKIKYAIPDWLNNKLQEELPENWQKELPALNQPAEVVLRANTLKTETSDLQNQLAQQNIITQSLADYPTALVLENRQNIFKNALFQQGYFEVQDASSQLVAPYLETSTQHTVVDACAGAGGKTLHLAALMHNKGRIIALDTEAWKLQELKKRAKRAGATQIETRLIENNKIIKRLYDKADRLLLDVPCSGLGVLRRNPDAKWKLSPQFIEELKTMQETILQQYSPMLKAGGKMVYATCSILPSENNQQIDKFLNSSTGKSFTLIKQQSILSHIHGFDGFYMALLEKI